MTFPRTGLSRASSGAIAGYPGVAAYLADELRIYNERGWHWAFYTFRGEGSWTGLDYEIPPNAPLGKLWEAEKRGDDLEALKPRRDNPVWAVIQRELKRRR